MKIIVLVKQVPDTWSDRKLDPSTGLLDRTASERVIDEVNERALEVALQYKDTDQAEIIAVAMGPASATEVLRKALSMGADSAIHIQDDGLGGADAGWTAAVIAGAIAGAGYDLVVAGGESTDGRGGVVPAMIAEHLGVAHLTFLDSVTISAESVGGTRATEYGDVTAHATLPAVISVTDRAAEPRFPTFSGIMKAKKKPVITLSLGDIALSPDFGSTARSVVLSTTERPPRVAGRKIVDDGGAVDELADFLAAARLI